MEYLFSPVTAARLLAGNLVQVQSLSGQLLPIVRDPVTGQFVEIAKGIARTSVSSGFNPLVAPLNLTMGAAQMYQTHRGFTAVLKGIASVQHSLGILQATTAVIGVGTFVGVGLTAVNLYQTLKLKKAVERMELKIEEGFLNLHQALQDQGEEVIRRIEQVAQDIKFEQHRVILVRAYGLFVQALQRLKAAMKINDPARRDTEIDEVRGMLFTALADYANPHLMEDVCAAGQLRRMECTWAIEQAIITTYQLQQEFTPARDRLTELQHRMRQDKLLVIDRIGCPDETRFLFPEVMRLCTQDLLVLESWGTNIEWIAELSPADRELMSNATLEESENVIDISLDDDSVAEPEEMQIYERLNAKSHDAAIRDQLKFMVQPALRRDYEAYITQQANAMNQKALAPSDWEEVPDAMVANLYWYCKDRAQEREVVLAS